MKKLLIRWFPRKYGEEGAAYNQEYTFTSEADANNFIQHMGVCYGRDAFKVLDEETVSA